MRHRRNQNGKYSVLSFKLYIYTTYVCLLRSSKRLLRVVVVVVVVAQNGRGHGY